VNRRVLTVIAAILSAVMLSAVLAACSEETVNGAMTEVKNDKGVLTGYERRYHNDHGDITRLDVYDTEKEYKSFVLYEYDDEYRLFTETYYKADGIATSRIVYTYDDDGKLYEKAYEYPHGESNVERYDKEGENVEKLYYDTDGKLIKHETLKDGKWVETKE